MYEDIIKADKLLKKLIEVTNTGIMEDIGSFIDGLDEDVCKNILRMIAYGSYKDFIKKD